MPDYTSSNSLGKFIISAVMFFVLSAASLNFIKISENLSVSQSQNILWELAFKEATTLERHIERSLLSARILGHEVIQNNGHLTDFESYAQNLLETFDGVSNLQLAPAGIITDIYPLKGNEQAIGHNLFVDDQRAKEAFLSRSSRELTLAGPFELVQGGFAVVGRNPVYIRDGSGKDHFWGFSTALMHMDHLLNKTMLQSLANEGYAYELSRINPDSGKTQRIAKSSQALSILRQDVPIVVPNATWTLTLSMAEGAISSSLWDTYRIGALLFSFSLAWLLHKVLQQPERLQNLVAKQTKDLRKLAYFDHLTQLKNRSSLKDEINKLIADSKPEGISAFVLIDIDDFKKVNDLNGHHIGDELLIAIGKRLPLVMSNQNAIFRIGGDEFALVIKHCASIDEISDKVSEHIQALRVPFYVNRMEFNIAVSAGIAIITQDSGDFNELYRHADLAMYEAKRKGKNNFYFYDESLTLQLTRAHEVERSLSEAIKDNQLRLFYQPIINFKNGKTAGYEALIRWQHPSKGLLGPFEFIPAAEETHVILEIGYWVLREACSLIKQNPTIGFISINISPKQFRDPFIISHFKNIVDTVGISYSQIVIEITESSLIDDINNAIKTMVSLRELGFRLSLDDFGTGYSSLTLLQKLPVQKLKIDQAFVRNITANARDKTIVCGIIDIAHDLGIGVVAEGIETAEHHDILNLAKADFGQGYFYGRPSPLVEVSTPSDVALGK